MTRSMPFLLRFLFLETIKISSYYFMQFLFFLFPLSVSSKKETGTY